MSKKKIILITIVFIFLSCMVASIIFIKNTFVYHHDLAKAQEQCYSILYTIKNILEDCRKNNMEYPDNIVPIIFKEIKDDKPFSVIKTSDGKLLNKWKETIIIKYEKDKEFLHFKIVSKIEHLAFVLKIDYNIEQNIYINHTCKLVKYSGELLK